MRYTQHIAISAFVFVMTTGGIVGCEEPFEPPERRAFGTFGQELYRFLHREFLWSGTAEQGPIRAAGFARHEDRVVEAFDRLATGPVETGMLPLLETWLPLYEPEAVAAAASIPTMTRDTADMLELLRAEPGLAAAFAAASDRPRAFPNALLSLLGAIVRHDTPIVDRLLDLTSELEPLLTELFRYLHRELPTTEDFTPLADGERSLLARIIDIELESGQTPVGPPAFAVRVDARGALRMDPRWTEAGATPFVDSDGDGRPDVDARGRAIDAEGKPLRIPTFSGPKDSGGLNRDVFGRGSLNGRFLYDYVDLRKSLLAFAMRDVRTLLDRGAHYDLFTTFNALIGVREERSDADGTFMGYRIHQSPLLDILHCLNDLRSYPRLIELTRATEHLITSRELLVRNIALDLARAVKIFEDAPDLQDGLLLIEDLHPVLERLAKHGGLRSLIAVSGLPAVNDLVPSLRTMMRYTDMNLPSDMAVLQVPADVDALTFRDPTDWSLPDHDDSQRSWLQKATLLIADTAGAPAYLRFLDEIEIEDVRITDDMAVFYMEAIAGRAVLDLGDPMLEDMAVMLAPEFDSVNLSAEALNLYMNHDQPVLGNVRGLRGVPLRELYGPALLALQTSRSTRGLRPWVTRIVDSGHTRDIVDLFVVLAKHYGQTAYTVPGLRSEGTGIRGLEPFILKVLDDTRLVQRFLELSAWMHTATFEHRGQTLNVADEMDAFLRWLVDTEAGARHRTGGSVIPSRRGGFIEETSRLQILIHALDRLDTALDRDPEARAAWDRVDLLGTFLDLDDRGEFANRHFLDMALALVPIMADYIEQQVSRAEWARDVANFMPDLDYFVGSRGFTALVDIVTFVQDNPAHRALVDDLLAMLLAEDPPRPDVDVFGGLLRVVATFANERAPVDFFGPMLRATGQILDPSRRLPFRLADTLRAMRKTDPEQVTSALMANLLSEPEVQRIPLVGILDAFETGMRADPLGPGELSADEWETILDKFVHWFRDEDKGAERLYRVILSR